jgi:L-cystine uptake protein TcyP (sodium:dicarboxylate symporter family)
MQVNCLLPCQLKKNKNTVLLKSFLNICFNIQGNTYLRNLQIIGCPIIFSKIINETTSINFK